MSVYLRTKFQLSSINLTSSFTPLKNKPLKPPPQLELTFKDF